MFKRIQFWDLESRISEPRNKIQVISGPRQVGKSTMVKQVLQEISIPYMFVSADNIDHTDTAWIGEMWATARARKKMAAAEEYLLVIDEVHKIDNWSEAVKKEWDEDIQRPQHEGRHLRFLQTSIERWLDRIVGRPL